MVFITWVFLYGFFIWVFSMVFCRISHFATADEYTDTTLHVITIEKRQYGTYVCKAANRLGTAEGRVELFGTIFTFLPFSMFVPARKRKIPKPRERLSNSL